MYKDLTKKQQQIMDCILSYVNERGYPPTIRELCDMVGLSSTSSVSSHLDTLEEKGYIRRTSSKNRAIEVVTPEGDSVYGNASIMEDYVSAPIIGTISAGVPLFAEENIDGYFPVPVEYLSNDEVFFLRVKGDSMKDAGILNGDLALIKKQSTASNGDIVAALLDDNATIKTFYKEATGYRLQPENEEYSPIYTSRVDIMGTLAGIVRMYKRRS